MSLKDCIELIKKLLSEDGTLSNRTPLTIDDIIDLLNLCLSTSDFVYNDIHHTATDSGPIGLSLMVVLAEIWMDFTLKEACKIAEQRSIAVPRALCVYMDDTFGILRQNQEKDAHAKFTECLTAVHPRLNFTHEIENDNSLPFLDILIIRQPDGSLSTKVYRKASNTGLTIHPKSNQDPKTWIGVFKGALCRAYRLCSSQTYIDEEIKYLIQNYEDNGFKRRDLEEIAQKYRPPGYVAPPLPPPPPPPDDETPLLRRLRPTAARLQRQQEEEEEEQQQQQQRKKRAAYVSILWNTLNDSLLFAHLPFCIIVFAV